MKRALVIGSKGQDGRIACRRLLDAGHVVIEMARDGIRCSDGTPFAAVDLRDATAVEGLVAAAAPDEIYYLAAYHHSSEEPLTESEPEALRQAFEVNVAGLCNCLEAVRRRRPAARLFYAASSRVFGTPVRAPQDESTPFAPECYYGITKTAGIHLCRRYRREYGMHAATGILYNHESIYRTARFLSRKIIGAAVATARGRTEPLVLGALSVRVDWGYAPDYVDAMERILALPAADDFVIASGELHTVEEFAAAAFSALGLDWHEHVREDRSMPVRRHPPLTGNAAKLRAATGWHPRTAFTDMIRTMVQQEQVIQDGDGQHTDIHSHL